MPSEKKKEEGQSSWRTSRVFLNIFHVCLLFLLIFAVFRAVICVDHNILKFSFWKNIWMGITEAGLNDWFTFIGALAFILFGITGIYEYAYVNGIRCCVPPFYIEFKNKSLIKQTEIMMDLYYEKDLKFIELYEDNRALAVMQTLGLSETQFHNIRYEILKARARTAHNLTELKTQAEQILYNKDYIFDLNETEPTERTYQSVEYYIDLYTALYDSDACENVCQIMCNFIYFTLKEKMEQIDYLVIPYGGNLLLGLAVGKKLKIPVISILEEGRMIRSRPWDGNYKVLKEKKNQIIILHDVLVSGRRIYEGIRRLPDKSYELLGVFSLIYYKSEEDVFSNMIANGIESSKNHYLLQATCNKIARKLKNT